MCEGTLSISCTTYFATPDAARKWVGAHSGEQISRAPLPNEEPEEILNRLKLDIYALVKPAQSRDDFQILRIRIPWTALQFATQLH